MYSRENRLLTLILLQGMIEGTFQHGFSRFYLVLRLREVRTFGCHGNREQVLVKSFLVE